MAGPIDPIPPLSRRSRWELPAGPPEVEERRRRERERRERERSRPGAPHGGDAAYAPADRGETGEDEKGEDETTGDAPPGAVRPDDASTRADRARRSDAPGGRHVDVRA